MLLMMIEYRTREHERNEGVGEKRKNRKTGSNASNETHMTMDSIRCSYEFHRKKRERRRGTLSQENKTQKHMEKERQQTPASRRTNAVTYEKCKKGNKEEEREFFTETKAILSKLK